MDMQTFIPVLVYLTPVVSALICSLIMIMAYYESAKDDDLLLKRILACYYTGLTFSWFGLLIYAWYPQLFAHLHTFVYLTFLFIAVLFYHFIFIVTRLDGAEKFSFWHYVPPVIISGSLLIWSFFIPFDVEVAIVKGMGEPVAGYEWYSWYFTLKIPVRFVFSLVYTSLGIYRVWRYNRAQQIETGFQSRYSLKWLNVLLAISFVLLLMPLMTMMTSRATVYRSLWMIPGILILLFLQFSLTVNLLRKNYHSIPVDREKRIKIFPRLLPEEIVSAPPVALVESTKQFRILTEKPDKNAFHDYFRQYKPYIHSDLSLNDLIKPLCMSRNTLSRFINHNFGMNFNRYIGVWRMLELEKLLMDAAYAKYPLKDLLPKAGFGSYRTYARIKEEITQLGIDAKQWI